MHPCTILYVDRYEPIRATIKLVLEQAGYEVVTAETVQDAFPILQSSRHIDAVILEYTLCSHDHGGAMCTAAQVRQCQPHAKILVWASGSSCKILSPCADMKMLKPIAPPELIANLERVLKPKARAAAAN